MMVYCFRPRVILDKNIHLYYSAGLGECLSDSPSQEEYVYPEVPAGELYVFGYQFSS